VRSERHADRPFTSQAATSPADRAVDQAGAEQAIASWETTAHPRAGTGPASLNENGQETHPWETSKQTVPFHSSTQASTRVLP
jgi:hypothetical protein